MLKLFLGYDYETALFIEDAGVPPGHAPWLGRLYSFKAVWTLQF